MTESPRQDASDRRQNRAEDRADASSERMDLSDARQDATSIRMDLGDHRMDLGDDRSDRSELLAKQRHRADVTQRVMVVVTIVVVVTIIVLQSVVLFHVVSLEQENKQLNLQLIAQQELLGQTADTITRTTLYAVACAEPPGPESIKVIQACIDKKIATE